MILSHEHQFIFFKATKTAGTSLEINLAGHCGDRDVITPITEYAPDVDDEPYEHVPRNHGGYRNHMTAIELRQAVPPATWDAYHKFTVVRNPWDLVASRYFWELHKATEAPMRRPGPVWFNRLRPTVRRIRGTLTGRPYVDLRSFTTFVRHFPPHLTNDDYYLDESGGLLADQYLRFEHLDEDYRTLCTRIAVPYEPLPRLKSKIRKEKRHYSELYDQESREKVARDFSRQIRHFGYRFERTGEG